MPIALTLPMPGDQPLARDAAPDAALMRDRLGASDAQLLGWTAAGDRLSFDALAARHLPRLHRLALRILLDHAEAEDVTQEAMLRAWEHAGRYDGARGSAGTWLQRILVNAAIDRLRRRGRQPSLGLEAADLLADDAPGAEAALLLAEEVSALRAALASLPARQRAAVALAYEQELSSAEAAAALAVSARGLEGLLHRARARLAERLAGLLGPRRGTNREDET